jgi:arsenate reductase
MAEAGVVVWYNPRCSKCRGAEQLLAAYGVPAQRVFYLDNPPARAEITRVLALLETADPRALMRTAEPRYRELGLAEASPEELIDAMTRLADERVLRAYDAELVSLWVGKDGPGLGAGLPDVDPACPEFEKAVDLLIAVRGAAGEVKMHAVLDYLLIGDRHEAHADRCVLVSPDDDLILALGQDLPAERLRPEPGQAGQIVSVNDDVVESDRHADSMLTARGPVPR